MDEVGDHQARRDSSVAHQPNQRADAAMAARHDSVRKHQAEPERRHLVERPQNEQKARGSDAAFDADGPRARVLALCEPGQLPGKVRRLDGGVAGVGADGNDRARGGFFVVEAVYGRACGGGAAGSVRC